MVERQSKVIRYRGRYRWRSVKTEPYKKDLEGWALIVRNVLIGQEGDGASMHLRYFEISEGGCSSLEYHNHEHIVIGIRGKGTIRLGDRQVLIKPLDAVYIAPKTIHQLSNNHEEPFGFFCIVKAKRDAPKIVKSSKG